MAAGPAFRLFGIPVRFDLSFFVIVALLGFGAGDLTFLVLWVVVVTVSILVHELGHAVTFRAFGKQPEIVLQGMGGLTSAEGTLPPGRDILVSLAGPLAGLVLIGLPALWLQAGDLATSPEWDRALRVIVYVNVAWSLVNLMPVLPLDGGRIAAAALKLKLGERSDRVAHILSAVVAGGAALWSFAMGDLFLAMFAAFFVAYNVSQLTHLRGRDNAGELLVGYQALGRGDVRGALAVARPMVGSSSRSSVAQGMELEAWVQVQQRRSDDAEAALSRLPPGHPTNLFLHASIALVAGHTDQALDGLAGAFVGGQVGPWNAIVADLVADRGLVDPLVDRVLDTTDTGAPAVVRLQGHLYYAGRYAESARAGERAFRAGTPDPANVAYDVACALARHGSRDQAITWLGKAVDAGFSDGRLLDEDPDLEALRAETGFQALRGRL